MKPQLLRPHINTIDLSKIYEAYGYTESEVKNETRKIPRIVECQHACWLYIKSKGYTLQEIAHHYKKHHTSIIYGIRSISGFIDSYPKEYEGLKSLFNSNTYEN